MNLKSFVRGPSPLKISEAFRAGLGAAAGVATAGVLARALVDGRLSILPLLVAPIGASAVLAFAVPASPLAQPRAILGGNLISVLVGLACALMVPHPLLAAALAVGLAILAMALLGCLHPPGGAVALGVVLTGVGSGAPAYGDTIVPVALCSLLLVAAAVANARLTGHSYPHQVAAKVSPHGTKDTPPAERLGYTMADLDTALAQYGDLLDVSRDDLDVLFRQVEAQAQRRIHSKIRCADIMSRDVISVDVHQNAESALAYLQSHDLRTAPVVDAEGKVVGMVRRAELLAGRRRLVETVLDPFVHKVRPGTPIEALLPLLSSGSAHEVMVVDADRVLVGVITQTDLLAVLYRAYVVEAMASANAA
jgi:CBS domain-containing membrane protein